MLFFLNAAAILFVSSGGRPNVSDMKKTESDTVLNFTGKLFMIYYQIITQTSIWGKDG